MPAVESGCGDAAQRIGAAPGGRDGARGAEATDGLHRLAAGEALGKVVVTM